MYVYEFIPENEFKQEGSLKDSQTPRRKMFLERGTFRCRSYRMTKLLALLISVHSFMGLHLATAC